MAHLNPTPAQISAFLKYRALELELRESLKGAIRAYTPREQEIVDEKTLVWDQMSEEQRRCWTNGSLTTGGRHTVLTGVEPSLRENWHCIICNMVFPGGLALNLSTEERANLLEDDYLRVAAGPASLPPLTTQAPQYNVGIGVHNPSETKSTEP